MKKTIFVMLCMAFFTPLAFASQSNAHHRAVDTASRLSAKGYHIHSIPGRHLRHNHYRTYNRFLYSGTCYGIVGVGDQNIWDLDVVVYSPSWNYVTSDSGSSRVSAVEFCPTRSGMYHIRTRVRGGAGWFYQVIGYRNYRDSRYRY